MLKEYFPLGQIQEDRYELSKRYGLVEFINGVHRITEKCRKNYDEIDYLKYLKGTIDQKQVKKLSDKPIRKQTTKPKQPKKKVVNDPNEFRSPECQKLIDEILSL